MTQTDESQRSVGQPSRGPFEDLRQGIGRWWDRDWWPWPVTRFTDLEGWTPRVDVYMEGQELVVKVELPGVNREDVEVTLEDDTLVIRGQCKQEKEDKERAYYRIERCYGSFYRRLPLPIHVQPEAVKASFKDGILEVRMPKPSALPTPGRKVDVT